MKPTTKDYVMNPTSDLVDVIEKNLTNIPAGVARWKLRARTAEVLTIVLLFVDGRSEWRFVVKNYNDTYSPSEEKIAVNIHGKEISGIVHYVDIMSREDRSAEALKKYVNDEIDYIKAHGDYAYFVKVAHCVHQRVFPAEQKLVCTTPADSHPHLNHAAFEEGSLTSNDN